MDCGTRHIHPKRNFGRNNDDCGGDNALIACTIQPVAGTPYCEPRWRLEWLFPPCRQHLSGLRRRQVCLCRVASGGSPYPSLRDSWRHDCCYPSAYSPSTMNLSRPLYARHEQLLRVSQARLADLQTGKRPPEIDVTRAQLMQALAEKQKSVDLLKSYESQYAAGGVSLTDLISARAAVESNTALVRQVESELVVAALPARDQQLKAQAESSGGGPCRSSTGDVEAATERDRIASGRPGVRHALSRRRVGRGGKSRGAGSAAREPGSSLLRARAASWEACKSDKTSASAATAVRPTFPPRSPSSRRSANTRRR